MKKIFLLICTCIVITGLTNSNNASASTNHVIPKAPYVSPSLKPCIAKYRQENYTGRAGNSDGIIRRCNRLHFLLQPVRERVLPAPGNL